jgi:hypothetical protein
MYHKRMLPRAVLAAFAAALTIGVAGAGTAAAAAPADVADDIPNLVTPVLVQKASPLSTSEDPVEAVVARGADDSLVISRRNRPMTATGRCSPSAARSSGIRLPWRPRRGSRTSSAAPITGSWSRRASR